MPKTAINREIAGYGSRTQPPDAWSGSSDLARARTLPPRASPPPLPADHRHVRARPRRRSRLTYQPRATTVCTSYGSRTLLPTPPAGQHESMHPQRSCPHPHPPGPHSEFREPRRCTMRQHPLLAFATAVPTIAIVLLGAVGSAGAATASHRSAQSTSTSRSTLAAGSALTLPLTLAPPLTLASPTVTRHIKPSLKAAKRAKRATRGRLEAKVSNHAVARVSIERHLVVPLGGVWSQLRSCESGGNYSADTGNGYYGAYQFALSTWRGLRLGGLPSSASPQIQDDAAVRLQRLDGWDPWPRCSWTLGLRA
jgi:hypothetical protein